MLNITVRNHLKRLWVGSALVLAACGGASGGPDIEPAPVVVAPSTPTPPPTTQQPTGETDGLTDGLLRDRFASSFKVGAVLSRSQIDTNDQNAALALSQFSSITPSFQLKADWISPTEGVYNFEDADRVVDWAIANGMEVRGHALVWHEGTPDYFYEGTREEIRARLETYISTVVEHFRGRVTSWDVANEVVSVDLWSANPVGPDRRSRWFEAVGNADYIDWAFHAARAADPNAKLYLNEYSTEHPIKGPWMIEILQRLQDRGVPIDGVGHQFHLSLADDPAELMQAIDNVDNLFMGLDNQITELDVDFYNDPGSCWSAQTGCDADLGAVAPVDMLATQAALMRGVFEGLSQRSSVSSVTTWGVTDDESWLNTSPAERFNYPLLFDRQGEPKSAFWAVVDPDYVIPTE